MAPGSRYCPRIYFVHPLLAGPLERWPGLLREIADLGFDHVLLPPPFVPGRDNALWLVADHDRLHPALAFDGDAERGLARLAQQCTDAGLALLIDLAIDKVAAEGALAQTHPSWFRNEALAGDEPPDPRFPPEARGAALLRFDDEAAMAAAGDWWLARLRRWTAAGVAGFCCQAPQRWPADFTRRLFAAGRAGNPQLRFIAATTGLSWSDHALLAGRGYDASIASTAWWDYRAPWLLEEQARLRRIGPPIATVEGPFAPRLAQRVARRDLLLAAARRALDCAAALGSGLLVPMGFEYGAEEALDPCRGTPGDFAAWRQRAPVDLRAELRRANALAADVTARCGDGSVRQLSGPGAAVGAFLRVPGADARSADEGLLLLLNPDLERRASVAPTRLLTAEAAELNQLRALSAPEAEALPLQAPLLLEGGEVRLLQARRSRPVLAPALTRNRRAMEAALRLPRVAIERITPCVDGGSFVVKRTVGELVRVEADAFMDGHDQVAVMLLWRPADESAWRETPMHTIGNDRWAAEFPLQRIGRHCFTVEAWRDAWQSYRHEIEKKHAAHLDLTLELQEGQALLEHGAASAGATVAAQLRALAQQAAAEPDAERRIALLLAPETAALMARADTRPFGARHEPAFFVDAERPGAGFAAWYELFPRSQSGSERHGSFDDVIAQLPRVRDMGFDVLYFPPIHPIGRKHRKGPNNTLTPGPGDPGSPYAIGSPDGGHDAIEPQLGTLEDFRRLRDAARDHGLELALDFAIQCAPDHPWLKDHPEWFAWRPDGTIKYAENPPKKYEDIVNVDFYAEGSMPGLWLALRDVILFWVNEGVKLFRVDNPHTKPLPFWKWMIADVRGRHPEVVFLSEAFTRPALMRRLAKLGYSQSYTYFTWRNSKHELVEYMTELTQTEMREYFRPHFFVNTPDINPYFLQTSGRAGFQIRAALAATLSGLWGVYSGFELCEARPVPGKEEYLDSEKYQVRVWDWERPGNIGPDIALLNRLRRRHPALHTHLNLRFHHCWNDQILYYAKSTPEKDDYLLIAVSMDPHHAQEADFELPLWDFGLPDHGALAAEDLVRGHRFTWHGKIQHLRLTPDAPFAIWRVQPA